MASRLLIADHNWLMGLLDLIVFFLGSKSIVKLLLVAVLEGALSTDHKKTRVTHSLGWGKELAFLLKVLTILNAW